MDVLDNIAFFSERAIKQISSYLNDDIFRQFIMYQDQVSHSNEVSSMLTLKLGLIQKTLISLLTISACFFREKERLAFKSCTLQHVIVHTKLVQVRMGPDTGQL